MTIENEWKAVWERKGTLDTINLKLLDGYENTNMDIVHIAKSIIQLMNIDDTDTVLEVGCGAGMLAQYLNFVKQYIGVDYSSSLVKKHIKLLKNSVLQGDAADLVFKDKTFDKVICYSVFHYFVDLDYAMRAINELVRVARKSVLIGDLPRRSHRGNHLLYNESIFSGWEITTGFYNPDRFNALLRLE